MMAACIGVSHGEGERRSDWKCVLEVELTELADGLDVVTNRKRRT